MPGGSEVQRALTAGVLFARGAFEGVVAAGGQLDAAFAQVHCLFDGDDLEAGDGGEAGFSVQARRGRLGDHRLRGFGQGEEHADAGPPGGGEEFK